MTTHMPSLTTILAVVIAMSCASEAIAADPKPADILARFPSAVPGVSLWERVRRCGFVPTRAGSHVDVIIFDSADGELKKGDVAIQLWTRSPRPIPGETGMLWRVRGKTITPQTGWAERIQNSRAIPELQC